MNETYLWIHYRSYDTWYYFFVNHNSRALKTLMLFYFLLLFSATGVVCAALVTHRCSKSYWTCRPCSRRCRSFEDVAAPKHLHCKHFFKFFFHFMLVLTTFSPGPGINKQKFPINSFLFSAITLSV